MIDKVQKIKEWISKEQDGLMDAKGNFEYPSDEGAFHILSRLDHYIDSLQEEPVSENLEEAAYYNCIDRLSKESIEDFKDDAKWQNEHLWKPADGDDLPIFDREVIVLIKYNTQRNIHDKEYSTYKVGFGHRPNPDGWDGKNIDTNEVTHYTPKLYDKGGWNAPDIVYWLDVELPKEIEL